MLTQTMRLAYCVFLGHELVATVDVAAGSVNDSDSAAACEGLSSYLALEAASVQVAEEQQYRDGSLAAQLADKIRGRAVAKTQEYFSNLAAGGDDGSRPNQAVLSALNSGGVVKLLEPYPNHVDWLARLSLSAGGGCPRFDTAAAHWRTDPGTIAEWLARVNSATLEACGKQAFVVADNEFGLGQF